MVLDHSLTLSAFKFVCGENDHICRLCFATTENEEISFEDSVRLSKPYYDETMSFTDMFADLGMIAEPFLPQVLCIDCANTIVNSFLFHKLCQFSKEKWDKVLDTVDKTLEKSSEIDPAIKTAYLVINDDENIIFTTRKSCRGKTKKEALKKVKTLLTRRTNYARQRNKKSTTCGICGEHFSSKTHLTKHKKTHSNKELINIPCRQCAKMFATKALLESHEERVHLSKTLQCPKCAKMFSTERMLRQHDKNHHIATICDLCFKQFPSKNALRQHLDKHVNLKCDVCNKDFYSKHAHKMHVKICGNINSKKPAFFCDICNKGYARKNSLRTHLKIDHGFGQVLPCPWCGKKFDAGSRLRNHIVKHTKEKNFDCDQCGGKFVTQAALTYHTRLHTGERPFPCDLCNETFLSASRRMGHKRRKHLAPTKECPLCNMKFVTSYQLKKHEDRHYNPQSKLYLPAVDKLKQPDEKYNHQNKLYTPIYDSLKTKEDRHYNPDLPEVEMFELS